MYKMYTLPQKKHNFSEVAFLLGRSVDGKLWAKCHKLGSLTLVQGHYKNLEIKVVFLLGKSVCH